MNKLKLEILSQRAHDAIACSYCFMREREKDWGHVPERPADRRDDVPFLPWVGPRYSTATPRVMVMMPVTTPAL